MVLKKCSYLNVALLLLAGLMILPIVTANTNWFTWGNYHDRQDPETLFSSNFPLGNVNFENQSDSVTISYPPVVADIDNDNDNEIIIASGSNLLIYSPLLELEYSTAVGGTIISSLAILNSDFDPQGVLEIGFMTAGTLNIYRVSGGALRSVSNATLSGQTLTEYSDFATNNVAVVSADGSNDQVLLYDIVTGTTNNLTYANNPQDEDRSSVATGSHHGLAVADTNKDGTLEYWKFGGSSRCVLVAHDGSNNVHYANTVLLGGSGTADCDVATANIGSVSSNLEIVTRAEANEYEINIIDSAGTTVFTHEDNDFVGMPSVADINLDGYNEFCFINSTNEILCYDRFYRSLYNITNPSGVAYNYMGIAEYETGNSYMEILLPEGLYTFDGTDTLTKIYGFDLNDPDAMAYPVVLEARTSLIKDVLVFNDASIYSYLGNGTLAVCGNGVCDLGETTITCFEDCFVPDEDEDTIKITRLEICPSIDYVWRNGTRVRITAQVETTDGADVQASAWLYAGSATEWTSGYTSSQPSGTNFVFESFANHTTFGTLKVIGRKSTLTSIADQYTEQFAVFADEGWTFQDGCSVLDDPLDTSQSQASQDTNLEVGDYCDTNDQCRTDWCRSGKCAYKLGSATCARGSECLSGRCINQKCTAPSFWQNAESLKTEMSGDDDTSNNIIALALILLGAVFVGYAMGKSMGGKAGVLMALGIMVTGIIFFTLVGWLNPIFLVGIIVLALIGLVMVFMMRGDSS